MAIAALILAILGILLSLIPSMGATQMGGAGLGIAAVLLGMASRGGARAPRLARVAVGTGIGAIVLAGVVFGSCQLAVYRAGERWGERVRQAKPRLQRQLRRGMVEGLGDSLREKRKAPTRRHVSPEESPPKKPKLPALPSSSGR